MSHLSPWGGVPVKTKLDVAGQMGDGYQRSGLAVERSQWPLIPYVITLDLSHLQASSTVLRALSI